MELDFYMGIVFLIYVNSYIFVTGMTGTKHGVIVVASLVWPITAAFFLVGDLRRWLNA
jgi:hypothetical protein